MGCGTSSETQHSSIQKDEIHENVTRNTNGNSWSTGSNPMYGGFEAVDQHALNTPGYVRRSVRDLSHYLIGGSTDHLKIARCFYRWITENITYDTESYFGNTIGDVDAAYVLHTGTSVCSGYSNLFAELCNYAGIQNKVMNGYSKGYGYSPEIPFTYRQETDHAWNAVYIDNQWRLLDCTWGAGIVNDNRQFEKRFDDFYFLTEPVHFINDHFPFVDNDISGSFFWQLLDKPITIEEFDKRVKLGIPAMKGDLNFSQKDGVINVSESVSISIADPGKNLVDASMHLSNSRGENCDECVFFRPEKNDMFILTIRFPKSGTYKLEVFGSFEKGNNDFDELVSYILKCKSAERNFRPYPKHSGLWGVNQSAYNIGFSKSIANTICKKTSNGQLALKLLSKDPPLSMAKLTAASSMVDLERYVLVERDYDCLNIHIHLPGPGYYKLEVFCKKVDSDYYDYQMCYLIESDQNLNEQVLQFPESFPLAQEYFCKLLEPLKGNLPANRSVKFRFKSPKLVQGFIGDETLVNNDDLWETTANTQQAGGHFEIYGSDIKGDESWGLYKYDIV